MVPSTSLPILLLRTAARHLVPPHQPKNRSKAGRSPALCRAWARAGARRCAMAGPARPAVVPPRRRLPSQPQDRRVDFRQRVPDRLAATRAAAGAANAQLFLRRPRETGMTTIRALRIIRWTALGLIGLIVLGIAFLEFDPKASFKQALPVAGNPPGETVAGSGALIGGPFNLVDDHSHSVTDAAYRGRWMLVFFGYTDCPDDCPLTLQKMATALDALGARWPTASPAVHHCRSRSRHAGPARPICREFRPPHHRVDRQQRADRGCGKSLSSLLLPRRT